MQRVVKPEILDELEADDPRAVRSRRDLRMINGFMMSQTWFRSCLKNISLEGRGIVEIGAGEGILSNELLEFGPVTAVDLAPKPEGLDSRVTWERGDIFEVLPNLGGEVLVANLFLHHFERPALEKMAEVCEGYDWLMFYEPLLCRRAHLSGFLLWPLINEVTRHDMHVSINAGFSRGELPEIFGPTWEWTETTTLLGGLRVVGRRIK